MQTHIYLQIIIINHLKQRHGFINHISLHPTKMQIVLQ